MRNLFFLSDVCLIQRQDDETLGGDFDSEGVLLQLGILEGDGGDFGWMLEVVEVVNLLGGEDATTDGLGIETLDVEFDGLVFVKADIGE